MTPENRLEIKPEPTPEEREAIEAALAAEAREQPLPWRGAPDDERPPVTERP